MLTRLQIGGVGLAGKDLRQQQEVSLAERTELRTPRMLLRPYAVGDVDGVARLMADLESELYYAPLPFPPSREQVERFVKRRLEEPWTERAIFAAVMDGEIIGETCLLNVDDRNGTAELGYVIAKPHWGKGLAVEASRATIDWAFDAFRLGRIWATAHEFNLQSIRVLQKLGMKREGVLRKHVLFRGARADLAYFGLLRQEWQHDFSGERHQSR